MPCYLNLNKIRAISFDHSAVKMFFVENPDSSHLLLMFPSYLTFFISITIN